MAPPKKRKSSRQITPKATATKRIRSGRALRSTTIANSITEQEPTNDLRESNSVIFVRFYHLPETPVVNLVGIVNDGNTANAESREALAKANPSPPEQFEQIRKDEDEDASGSPIVPFYELPGASGDQISKDKTEVLVAKKNLEGTSREGASSSTTISSIGSISAAHIDDPKHGEEAGSSEILRFHYLPGTSAIQLSIYETEEPSAEPNLESTSWERASCSTTLPSISRISAAHQDDHDGTSSAQLSCLFDHISYSLSNTSAAHQGNLKHDDVELKSDEAPKTSDEGVGSPASLSESGNNSRWDMHCEGPSSSYVAYWKTETAQPEEVNAAKSESRSSSLVTEYHSCDEETPCRGFSD